MLPWNNWFHCIGSTYGSWLPGDSRGWRSRHHREHVEGDYKYPPPPGMYDGLHEVARRNMDRCEVVLTWDQRALACRAMAEDLQFQEVEFVDLAVGPAHFHLLARFTPIGEAPGEGRRIAHLSDNGLDEFEKHKRVVRHILGNCKRKSARALCQAGLAAPGGVWAVRGKEVPIADREHQLRVVHYIREHFLKEGAAVWSMIRQLEK